MTRTPTGSDFGENEAKSDEMEGSENGSARRGRRCFRRDGGEMVERERERERDSERDQRWWRDGLGFFLFWLSA